MSSMSYAAAQYQATTVWKNKKASADSEAKAIDAMGQQAGDAKGAVDAKAHEIQVSQEGMCWSLVEEGITHLW